MGIFSVRCSNPDCGKSVPRAAKFCRACGTPAPDADTNCGRCGAVVAASSKFCWKCGINQSDVKKTVLFDNKWVRDEDDFAVRVDECDVRGFLTKGLVIEHGTSALIFQQGRFSGTVGAGSYDVNGFLKKVNNFNQTTPASVVLVDSSDVQIHLEAVKLYSADQMEVDAVFNAVVRLKDPESFYTNAFKSRNILTKGYLAESITMELQAALQSYAGSKPVDQLYNNSEIRKEAERQMQLELEPVLERIGLEVVQLRFVDFFCPDYDEIRRKQSELYLDKRKTDIDIDRLKIAQHLRKEMSAEKMDTLKTDKDVEDFLKQAEHDLGLKGVIREDEMERLKRGFSQSRDKDILTHQIEIEGIRSETERDQARKKLDEDIEALLKKKEAERTVRAGDHGQDMKEAMDAVNLRRETQAAEVKMQEEEQRLEAEKLKVRSEASAQALLSILDGDAAKRIMKLEELRVKENLSPEQIISITAAESPDVARALAEKYKAEALLSGGRFEQMESFMQKQEQANRENADRMERVMNMALQQMGLTSTARAQAQGPAQTVLAPGARSGDTVVIKSARGEDKSCPKCKSAVSSDSKFCPECSHRL